jgi:glutathione synthase/RimK-type ligase-like ATP-grasp enzyme
MRIAFATTSSDVLEGDLDLDRVHHEVSFAKAGIVLDYCIWWDPAVSWNDYDLIVIRSTWDYVERLEEFREWLRRLDSLGTLRNPAPVVEWNLDKSYLLELHAEGLPIVPTRIVSKVTEIPAALMAITGDVIVKPTISAGSRNTGRFSNDDPRALQLSRQVLADGMAVMIQPCVPSVTDTGEVSAVLFNGAVSHVVRKGPILALGGEFLNGSYDEKVQPETLTSQQQRIVERTSELLRRFSVERFGLTDEFLYARIDMVTLEDGEDVVLEVELAEPTLFLSVDRDASERFVDAVTRQAIKAAVK